MKIGYINVVYCIKFVGRNIFLENFKQDYIIPYFSFITFKIT